MTRFEKAVAEVADALESLPIPEKTFCEDRLLMLLDLALKQRLRKRTRRRWLYLRHESGVN